MIWLNFMLAAFAFIGGIGLGMLIQEDLQNDHSDKLEREVQWYRRECVFNCPDGAEAIREADDNEMWG